MNQTNRLRSEAWPTATLGDKVGARDVVLDHVPPHHTVAGVPARIVGRPQEAKPARAMDQKFSGAHVERSGI